MWRAWPRLTELPRVEPLEAAGPARTGGLVVVAAHPDDEILGAGGLIAAHLDAGHRVRVVLLTDGEKSHPGGPIPPPVLRARRIRETERALAVLGSSARGREAGRVRPSGPEVGRVRPLSPEVGPVRPPEPEYGRLRPTGTQSGPPRSSGTDTGPVPPPGAEIVRLRLPDTEVAEHEASAVAELSALVAGFGACAAPWSGDVHGDHEAAGRAAASACASADVRYVEYPVWMWHWARPDDPRVPWKRAVRVDLTPERRRRKRDAIACFETQVRPHAPGRDDRVILPPEEIEHFLRPYEVVFR
nr:PIG-L family deacetylase [Streptomyces sp. SID3343]